MSQLHLLPRYVPSTLSSKNTRSVFFWHVCSHRAVFALSISLLLLLGSCETKDNNVIDSAGTAPLLTQVTLLPSRINSDSIFVGPTRQPDDLLTITPTIAGRVQSSSPLPLSVNYFVKSSDSLNIVASGTLLDDGLAPDHTRGDGLFSGKASFQIRRVQIGTYTFEVIAISDDGYRSNAIITPLVVFRGNRPPVISNLVAPDTVTLGNQTQVFLLTVSANDPDGLNDIAKVVFNSFRPDGSASGGNPFVMYDDGLAAHGDVKAGDGVYSLLISLPSNAQLGTYRFEFQGFDRLNEPSDIIILRLTVKP